jgi:hypothetical protein
VFLQKKGDEESECLENEKLMMRRLNHVCENDYVPWVICDGEEEFDSRYLNLEFSLFYFFLFFF